MSQLVKSIEGFVLPYFVSEVNYVKKISGLIQTTDYINLFEFKGFLQNLSQVDSTIKVQKPMEFGLKNNYNSLTVILEINK